MSSKGIHETTRRVRMRTLIGAASLAALLPIVPAHAGNAITISSISRAGETVTVTGSVAHDKVSFPVLGQEASGDDLLGGAGNLGGDLQGFSMDFEPTLDPNAPQDNVLRLRWKANLAPAPVYAAPGYVYGAMFSLNGQVAYEVNVARESIGLASGATNISARARLFRCGVSSNCGTRQNHGGSIQQPYPTAVMDPGTGYVTATVRGIVTSGDRIARVSAGDAIAFVGIGVLSEPCCTSPAIWDRRNHLPYASDWIDQDIGVFTAGLRLDAAVAEPGLDPSTVTYATRVALGANNSFSVSEPAAPGQAIYLQACHATTCFYAATDSPAWPRPTDGSH